MSLVRLRLHRKLLIRGCTLIPAARWPKAFHETNIRWMMLSNARIDATVIARLRMFTCFGEIQWYKNARNAEKYKKYPRHSWNFYFNPAIRRTCTTFVSQSRLMYSNNAEAFDFRLKIILSGWIKYCLSFLCVHKNTNLCKHLQSSGFEFFYCTKLRSCLCKGRRTKDGDRVLYRDNWRFD